MKAVLCVFSVVVFVQAFYEIRGCLQPERAALIQLRSYFTSTADHYDPRPFPIWPTDDQKSDCCHWELVRCSPTTGHVTHLFLYATVSTYEPWDLNMTLFHHFPELRLLDLSGNNIGRLIELPQGVWWLKNLWKLDLSSNFGISRIPDFLWNSSSLRVVDFSYNGGIGKIDARLCNWRNLRELYLPLNKLNGSIPDCLWNLSSLRALDLSGNSLTGNLPPMNNFPSLEYLSIAGNSFHGKVYSSSLKNLSSLAVLMLSNNALQVQVDDSQSLSTRRLQFLGLANCNLRTHTKTLQHFLAFQSELQYVDLSGNALVGQFPTWLLRNNSNLKLLYLQHNSLVGGIQLPWQQRNLSLTILDISSNKLEGNIPQDIGMILPALILLNMSGNSIQGRIPSSLSNMTQLDVLNLSGNKLFGVVPREVLSYCSKLGFLDLSNNNLEGEIIPSNMNLSSLAVLVLADNHFGGTIKDSFKQISSDLLYLDLSDNIVTGELPVWSASSNYLLDTISLARNRFYGSIPREQICNYTGRYLDLSENMLTGQIPFCGWPVGLSVLHLQGNSLTGAIPNLEGFTSNCYSLKILDIADNRLSGGIPRWFNMCLNLTVLMLGGNRLHGELPIQLCELQALNIIDLSRNNISGSIPSCFRNLSFGTSTSTLYFDAGIGVPNSLSLYEFKDHQIIPQEETGEVTQSEKVNFIVKNEYLSYMGNILQSMSSLDLSYNQLTGDIPIELGDLAMIHALNLSHNSLTGSIPKSFSKLRSIESLDLSYNKLSGVIPHGLVDMNFLGTFNVSYNNLSGEVPETAQFGSFDESSYRGNPLLCGSQLPKSCNSIVEASSSPPTEEKDEGDTGFDMEVFLWSFGASFVIVLLAFCLVLYINVEWRRAWFAFIDWHLLWCLY